MNEKNKFTTLQRVSCVFSPQIMKYFLHVICLVQRGLAFLRIIRFLWDLLTGNFIGKQTIQNSSYCCCTRYWPSRNWGIFGNHPKTNKTCHMAIEEKEKLKFHLFQRILVILTSFNALAMTHSAITE